MSEPPKHHLGDRLAAYIDGELPAATRQLVAAHLAMCSTCRVAAVREARTKSNLRDLGGPAPSSDLMASLLKLPGSTPAPPPAAMSPASGDSAFPVATRRRSVPTAPLLAAGVASVAALTVASAWLNAEGSQDVDSQLRQASTGVVNPFADGPDALPTGPQSSFVTARTGPATSGATPIAFVRLR
jgi:anti-sigma factor RsiW